MVKFDFSQQRVLITGSSRGIGLELAKGFIRSNARVILHGRDRARLELVRSQLGAEVGIVSFEVEDPDATQQAVTHLIETEGAIDILVNNAGCQFRAPLEEFPEDQWRRVLDVNLTAAWRIARLLFPGMQENGGGRIINIASLLSFSARPTIAAYAASKAGIAMLTKSMAVEWAKHNITANAIAPGYFATDMNQKLVADEQFDAWVKSRTPLGRWGREDELTGLALLLASPAASFITGQVIAVDGGWTAAL